MNKERSDGQSATGGAVKERIIRGEYRSVGEVDLSLKKIQDTFFLPGFVGNFCIACRFCLSVRAVRGGQYAKVEMTRLLCVL